MGGKAGTAKGSDAVRDGDAEGMEWEGATGPMGRSRRQQVKEAPDGGELRGACGGRGDCGREVRDEEEAAMVVRGKERRMGDGLAK